MPADPYTPYFRALCSVCHDLNATQLALFGSAARRQIRQVTDVDLHLVIPQMTREAYAQIAVAAQTDAMRLARAIERRPEIELRHGPFKPAPDNPGVLQLHVIVDDLVSLEAAPAVLRLQRAAASRRLWGRQMPLARPVSTAVCLAQARRECERWLTALSDRSIPFRRWDLSPPPRLVPDRVPAVLPWELSCLLGGACTSCDLHYLGALLSVGRQTDRAGEQRAMLDQLGDEARDWPRLTDRWEAVARRASTLVRRRLRELEELEPTPDTSRSQNG